MNILRRGILCIIIVLLTKGLTAQVTYKPVVWKKRVVRRIDTRDTLDAKGYVHSKEYGDTIFARMLIDKVKAGKLTLYATAEDLLSNSPISDNKRKEMLTPTPIDLDTEVITRGDSEYAFVPNRRFNIYNCTKYNMLEDWVFDPAKRESEIKILGVSLQKDIFGEEAGNENRADYRGSISLFWLKWDEASVLLQQFRKNYPQNDPLHYLWDDYFKYPELRIDTISASKGKQKFPEKLWGRTAVRGIDIRDTDCWDNTHFHDGTEDRTLFTEFLKLVTGRKLTAYSDSAERFTKQLSYNKISFSTDPDKIRIEDPVSGAWVWTFIHHDFNPDWFHTYSILEEWVFDPVEGKTNIRLKGIEPRLDKTGLKFIRYENLFWVRYEDVTDILDKYDEYHPLNNLSTALWGSYFKE